ncbi:heterokaryon incompatibility protein-domain-containing protein [Xylaria digitata]|nr:heterokaryon incompatibility protein-domain-containing protein [Xylaria digitata]
MGSTPRYLLRRHDGDQFSLVKTNGHSYTYDIVSYTWGGTVEPSYDYNENLSKGQTKINGLNWNLGIRREKVDDLKKLMCYKGVEYMWADSICMNDADKQQKGEEIPKMFQYYKQAQNCYLLMDMSELFDNNQIADDLKFLDHILSNIGGSSIVVDTMKLSDKLEARLLAWARKPWTSDKLSEQAARASGIDLGVMNCYNTCVNHVKSLFNNEYFTRVWTFQEMILGKNLQIVGVNGGDMSDIGSLFQWMELARDCLDKAIKLCKWIADPRFINTVSISVVLELIIDDVRHLLGLVNMVKGIDAARIDIINGGPNWWRENEKGISNIFSSISLTPRGCRDMPDLFKGLLGIFNGLFTPEEIAKELEGNDIEKMSFAFFRHLSEKTGIAWTKLAISSRERGEWDWIPVVDQKRDPNVMEENAEQVQLVTEGEEKKKKENHIKTDIFAGVVRLGVLRKNGRAKALGFTGLLGAPRKLMSIHLKEENPQFHFIFKGCNCGKNRGKVFSRHKVPTNSRPEDVTGDETGKRLAQCATILGCILDPAGNAQVYKRELLMALAPQWDVTDPTAKPHRWEDRSVSGTRWEGIKSPFDLATHNESMNYRMGAITECGSRLAKGSTAKISCEVRVNCGCTIIAPFCLIFEALTAVEGSPLALGKTADRSDLRPTKDTPLSQHLGVPLAIDKDDRITMNDGLGLVQIGDLGKTFNLVAFGGNLKFYKRYAGLLRSAIDTKSSWSKLVLSPRPFGRALIQSDFTHNMTHILRNYGYVETGGGNLLIYQSHPLGEYKINGVCIDGVIPNTKVPVEGEVVVKKRGVMIK